MSEEQIPLRNEVLSFEINKDGAFVCKINGTPGNTEGCIEAVLKWFRSPEIRYPQNIKLWDRLCESFGEEKLAETYFSFNNPYKIHIMRSDFTDNPEQVIRNMAHLFREGGDRRARDLEEWYRRETERDKRTDEREY
ncbi:MAG: hypothetical protein IKV00_05660 [Clostridia bacterium]|nr:hypothetical protein [Clostridia bacterium]